MIEASRESSSDGYQDDAGEHHGCGDDPPGAVFFAQQSPAEY
jgi:hypothetical protein